MCCLGRSGRGRLFLPLHQGSVIHRASCGCVCAQPQSGGCSPGMPWEGGLPERGVGLQWEWDLQGMVQVAVFVSVHTQNVWVSRAGEAVEDSSIALATGESVWAAAGNTPVSFPGTGHCPCHHSAGFEHLPLPTCFLDKRPIPVLCPWLILAVPRSLCPPGAAVGPGVDFSLFLFLFSLERKSSHLSHVSKFPSLLSRVGMHK